MPCDDRIKASVLVLQFDPIAERPGEMTQVAGAGGPQSAKNDFFLFFVHISSSNKKIDDTHNHSQDPSDETGHDQNKQDDKPVRPESLIFLGRFL